MYLLLVLSFTQNSRSFFFKLLLNRCTFERLTKNILFHCFGVRFVPPFLKKSQTYQVTKKPGKYLAKWLDKHGITPVRTTYRPWLTDEVSEKKEIQ